MGTLLECRVKSVSYMALHSRGRGVSGVEGHAWRGRLIAPGVMPKAAGACSAFFQKGIEEGFRTPPGGDSGDRSC